MPTSAPSAERGVVTSANDAMFHQLVALLHSIEANWSPRIPVCVVPYDDAVDRVRRLAEAHPQVVWWEDEDLLARWEGFAEAAWKTHPTALDAWEAKWGARRVHRMGMHRRLAAFEGPFERFLYLDADMLVLAPLDFLLDRLDGCELVVHDDQYRAPRHVFDLASPRLHEVFPEERIAGEVFCAGLFASRRGVLGPERREAVLRGLEAGDAAILYPWAPDQSLLNYAVLKCGIDAVNLYREGPEKRARTCATVPGLVERRHHLFDGGVRVPFLHYIGIPAWAANAVCEGRNVAFPYRDLLLHYRFLRDPGARPVLRGRAEPLHRPPRGARLRARLARWLG